MARKRALSAREVDGLTNKLGTHRVDENLYLQIRDDSTRSWVFRYSRGRKMRSLGLGAVRRLSYNDVRRLAAEYRVDLWTGIDIAAEHRSRREQVNETPVSSTAPTFGWCAEQYFAAHEAGWKSPVHHRQWVQTLEDYCGPVIGKKPVDQVDVDDVLKVLQPIWITKSETAGRLRGRISKVLGWAKAKGYRTTDDPAALGGPLDHLLPSLSKVQKIKHHESVPHTELPALAASIRKLASTSSKALLFTILTGVRTSETLGARRDGLKQAAPRLLVSFQLYTYVGILDAIVSSGRIPLTVSNYMTAHAGESGRGKIILRHDVDRMVFRSLAMANLEAARGLQEGLPVYVARLCDRRYLEVSAGWHMGVRRSLSSLSICRHSPARWERIHSARDWHYRFLQFNIRRNAGLVQQLTYVASDFGPVEQPFPALQDISETRSRIGKCVDGSSTCRLVAFRLELRDFSGTGANRSDGGYIQYQLCGRHSGGFRSVRARRPGTDNRLVW